MNTVLQPKDERKQAVAAKQIASLRTIEDVKAMANISTLSIDVVHILIDIAVAITLRDKA